MIAPRAVPLAVAWWRLNGLRLPRCGLCGLDLPGRTPGWCDVCLDRQLARHGVPEPGKRFDTKGPNHA
jgi:hypothetical protein